MARLSIILIAPILLILFLIQPALAAEEAPVLNSGDTAWMLTATALVLFMTIPGLSLFYAGIDSRKLWRSQEIVRSGFWGKAAQKLLGFLRIARCWQDCFKRVGF